MPWAPPGQPAGRVLHCPLSQFNEYPGGHYRGTGAVPVAATDSGEAQTVLRLTKRALVISGETCCDSVKNIVQNEFPLRNGMGALLTELIVGVPSIKRYYWSQFLVLVIIALIKAFLVIHSILYQKQMTQRCSITVYLYLGAYLHHCYVLYVEWITFILPGHWNIRYDSY